MRKLILDYLLTFSSLYSITVTALSSPIEPVRTMDVPGGCKLEIDGLKDESYSDFEETYWLFESGNFIGNDDFTAKFALSASVYYLYIIAEFVDDIAVNYSWGNSEPFKFDNFEVFLQLDTATVPSTYDSTTVYLRFCRGLDSVETSGQAPRSDYEYYMEGQTTDGWIAEIAIPWTAVLSESMEAEDILDYEGSPIGFDFAAADADEEGSVIDHQAYWDLDGGDGTEDLAWMDTRTFGYITFHSVPIPCYSIIPNKLEFDQANLKNKNLSIFPNPVNHTIEIMGLKATTTVTIFNLQGKTMLQASYKPGNQIDISQFESGIYIARLASGESIRFVKE